jgi:hypothetical protein
LNDLIAAHAKSFADDPMLVYWRAEVCYLKADYDVAAAGFGRFLKVAGEKESERFTAQHKQIRSLIRSGKVATARKLAESLPPDRVGPGLRAAIEAAAGYVDALDTLLAQHDKKPGGLFCVYFDEDFIRFVADEKFAEIRKKYPDPRKRE